MQNILNLSLITSFSPYGFQNSFACWPQVEYEPGHFSPLKHAELYTFFHCDLVNLGIREFGDFGVVSSLAECSDNSDLISLVAERIAECANSAGTSICAFASYIPEISSIDSRKQNCAKKSILFLAQLAGAMRKIGHPVGTIELVGGGCCGSPRFELTLDRLARSCAIQKYENEKVLRGILRIIDTDLVSVLVKNDVVLALEMEPGPLFALSSGAILHDITNLLGGIVPYAHGRIGLNLDIGHWAFLDHTGHPLLEKLLPWVCHSHCSDHHRGHFGDAVICSIHSEAEFLKWVRLLEERSVGGKEEDQVVRFSNLLSVEIECVRDAKILNSTIDRARKLLFRHPELRLA